MSAEAASRNDEITIELKGIRHVYKGGTVALKGIDLAFGKGLFGLLGPNGAGKSTLMKILCTLIEPSEGQARVAGYDVVKNRTAVRKQLGYLPQEFSAWRIQRVGEVVDTLAMLSGLRDGKQRKARVQEVLQQVGLGEVIDRKVKKLSGGMVRRLGVAQALVHDPQVIIVDEPTVGLDPKERQRFRNLMAELSQERTILLSTHIIADLGSSCHDLAMIDAGELVFRGSPAELRDQSHGRVFELVGDNASSAMGNHEVVARHRDADGIKLRAVSMDGNIPSGARLVDDPTFEEAYLAFMGARGRADAAREGVAEEAAEEGAE